MVDHFQPGPPPIQTHVRCTNCGYDLTGAAIGTPCPECGAIIGHGTLAASYQAMSGRAVASLVLGIMSVVGCFVYGLPGVLFGILAIAFASGVKQQVINLEVAPASAGIAKAGMICGIVGVSLGGALVLLVIIVMFGALMIP